MAVKSRSGKTPSVNKPAKPSPKLVKNDTDMDINHLIHERTRLALSSALAANDKLSFNDLKSLLKISDGNLSAHARKLEEAGYLSCNKGFDGRIPRTEYRLLARGRKALQQYLTHMEALITAMKKTYWLYGPSGN